MPLAPPNVLQFDDYRAFLKSFDAYKRQTAKHWNMAIWTRQLGIPSRSTLLMILNGTREPGPNLVARMSDYFKFSPREADYFSTLVRVVKATRDADVKLAMVDKLKTLNPQWRQGVIDYRAFEAMSQWYYPVLREMVRLADFREDPVWIARRLAYPLRADAARRALADLERLGLLRRDDNGRLAQVDAQVSTGDELDDEAIRRYHEQCIDNAKAAIRRFDVSSRYASGLTLVVRRSRLAEAKALIRKFEQDMIHLFDSPEGSDDEAVMQLNVQLHPHTRIEGAPQRNTTAQVKDRARKKKEPL